MLRICGNTCANINDRHLDEAFGANYLWTERFFSYVHSMVYSANLWSFRSRNDLLQAYLASVRPLFGLRRLPVLRRSVYSPPRQNIRASVTIIMSGNRTIDEARANTAYAARLPPNVHYVGTPANYTWHHVEGIRYVGRRLCCHMLLVASQDHRTRHYGAVCEYKWVLATGYRDD